MPHWLLTSTTCGTWLPGDRRGSVTSVRERRVGEVVGAHRIEHSQPTTPCEPPLPGLARSAAAALTAEPVLLTADQARAILAQFVETTRCRGWPLRAGAVMANHFHIVLEAPDGYDSRRCLISLKSYASRALNDRYGRRERWWTSGGSRRVLKNDDAALTAINYVLHKQPNPLAVFDPTQPANRRAENEPEA